MISVNDDIKNYFGDDSDGAVTISSSTQLTVPSKNGNYDGDMVVKDYSSLTINSSQTLTTDQPCRGMLIYVSGNCIINGTLSMTARGAAANPSSSGGSDASAVSSTGIRLPMLKSGETDTLAAADFAGCGNTVVSAVANQPGISGNGKIYTIVRTGAAGGAGGVCYGGSCTGYGTVGSNGTTGQSGGGAGGTAGASEGTGTLTAGSGAAGTCFSGGSGAGAQYFAWTSNWTGGNATAYGGKGGIPNSEGWTLCHSGGGAGNPGGENQFNGYCGYNTDSGTGGLLFLVVGGDLTIGASGSIQAHGKPGGAGGYLHGGGSGGGNVVVLYAGSLSNSGSVTATGGDTTGSAIDGGDGSVQGPTQVDSI